MTWNPESKLFERCQPTTHTVPDDVDDVSKIRNQSKLTFSFANGIIITLRRLKRWKREQLVVCSFRRFTLKNRDAPYSYFIELSISKV